MELKDYKAIAEIILVCTTHRTDNPKLKLILPVCISNELADYFEREDKKKPLIWTGRGETKIEKRFNKQKFLKDCGILK